KTRPVPKKRRPALRGKKATKGLRRKGDGTEKVARGSKRELKARSAKATKRRPQGPGAATNKAKRSAAKATKGGAPRTRSPRGMKATKGIHPKSGGTKKLATGSKRDVPTPS